MKVLKMFKSIKRRICVLIVLKVWNRRALQPPAVLHTEGATLLAGNHGLT